MFIIESRIYSVALKAMEKNAKLQRAVSYGGSDIMY